MFIVPRKLIVAKVAKEKELIIVDSPVIEVIVEVLLATIKT